MAAKYDLIVIGAGPAGEKGAAQAAYFGKRVSLVDLCLRPGGMAVSTAGIPTKAVREGAIYMSGLGQTANGVSSPSVKDPWPLTHVTIVGGSHLLPALDVEMAGVLAECFNSMGIRMIPKATVADVARVGSALEARLADGQTLQAQKILVAVGRRPQVEGLGLAEIGVEFDSAGWVRVDGRYATTAAGVFAAGDVIGPPGLAAVAMEQARVAICHAFGFEFKSEVDHFRPTYIFSIPEVAWVGLSEEQVRAAHVDYEVGRCAFGTNAKARMSGFPDGLVKLVFRVSDKVLLGVHIVGELASELIHIGQFVIQAGGTIDRFIDATFAVPTRSEAYKYAAYDG
jgi:NAD(P) transhydrogenase